MTATLEHLAEGLADVELSVREEAAQELAELESEEAVPYLLHALEDDAASVRMWGAYGLARLGRSEDLELLRERLDEEPSSLVRVWCAFGLANSGDRQAAGTLAGFLEDPSLDVRNNCGEAILSLKRPAAVLPHLDTRFNGRDPSARTWAAGVLAGLGRPNALEVWRQALLAPETRADAAVVASHLHAPDAARDLVRLVSELVEAELDRPVERAGGAPLVQLLTTPLLALGLEALLKSARKDEVLASELLILLARSGAADPEVLEAIALFFEGLPVRTLATTMVSVIEEQEPESHPTLLAGWAAYLSDATAVAIDALPTRTREALFARVHAKARDPDAGIVRLVPLFELLRNGAHAERFEDLPELSLPDAPEFMTDPLGTEVFEDDEVGGDDDGDEVDPEYGGEAGPPSEEDLAGAPSIEDGEEVVFLVQKLAAGEPLSDEERLQAESFLEELGMSAEEFVQELESSELPEDEDVGSRTPQDVARRALVLSALLYRLGLEEALVQGSVPKPQAAKATEELSAWLSDHDLAGALEPMERDLLEAPAGGWADEDRQKGTFLSEGLATLMWALGLREALAPFGSSVSAVELLEALPLLDAAGDFVAGASLRDLDTLSKQREIFEMWLWRAEQEEQLRAVIRGEPPEDFDAGSLIEELVDEGFPADALEEKLGRDGMIGEALRALARRAAQRLEEEGLLDRRVNGDFAIGETAFLDLEDSAVFAARSLAFERNRALTWVDQGGSWELMEEETFG